MQSGLLTTKEKSNALQLFVALVGVIVLVYSAAAFTAERIHHDSTAITIIAGTLGAVMTVTYMWRALRKGNS